MKALLLACGASFLAFLDATITNLAVPSLAGDFHASVTSLSWVVTLYTILFAAFLAPSGRLADTIGRTRLFATGATGFTLASLLAAVAPTFAVLLVARGIQGVSAALLIPASLALVLADTPAPKRPAAIGLWSASAALAAAAGPALGGVLVDAFGWRSLFCINLPVGAWLAWRAALLPRTRRTNTTVPDALGAVLVATAVGLLVLGVTEGPRWGWTDTATVACLIGSVAVGGVALLRASRHPTPALEVDLWRNRTYAAANVISVVFGGALYASLLLGVLFLVDVWGYSELQAGLAMTPGAIASASVGIAIGRSARKPSASALVGTGSLILAATSAALAVALPDHAAFLTAWLPGGIGLGIGIGAVSVGVSTAAAMSVSPSRFAAATGLNIAARQVGGALGVAVLAAILAGRGAHAGVRPFLDVYWLMAGLSLFAAFAGLRLRPATDGSGRQRAAAPAPATARVGQ